MNCKNLVMKIGMIVCQDLLATFYIPILAEEYSLSLHMNSRLRFEKGTNNLTTVKE